MDAKMITIMINNINPPFKSNHGFRNMDTDFTASMDSRNFTTLEYQSIRLVQNFNQDMNSLIKDYRLLKKKFLLNHLFKMKYTSM